MRYLKIVLFILITTILFCGLKSDIYASVTCPDNSTCRDNTYCRLKTDGKYDCPSIPGIKIGSDYKVDNPIPQFSNIADIINGLLPYAFTLAGVVLFVLLLASGFEFLTSAGDEKKLQQAKGRITSALVGFIIVVAAYWLTQIVEFLFHIQIF